MPTKKKNELSCPDCDEQAKGQVIECERAWMHSSQRLAYDKR